MLYILLNILLALTLVAIATWLIVKIIDFAINHPAPTIKVIVAVICTVILFGCYWEANAEIEERTAFVTEIRVFENVIVLRDEDGFPYPFPFSVFGKEMSERYGKEHTVYLDPEATFGRTFWLDVEVEDAENETY